VGKIIENPLSGERIVIRELPADSGSRLTWELFLAPGGRVPNSHVHPVQEELFTVFSGHVRFRLGPRRVVAGPGDTIRVPPGRVHHFANAGPEEARLSVETEPALEIVAMFEVAAALAQDQHARGRAVPRLVDLALFMRDFEAEVRAPYVPAALVRALVHPVAWLVRRSGHDARYRQLRARSAQRDGAPLPAPS
jgi:quercetin dioxygenase-like cupin family protein